MSRLTGYVCSGSPSADPHCFQLRQDIVFFSDVEFDEEIEPGAKEFMANIKLLMAQDHPDITTGKATNIKDIIDELNADTTRGKLPFGRIYICSHANPWTWFIRTAPPNTYDTTIEELTARIKEQNEHPPDYPVVFDPQSEWFEQETGRPKASKPVEFKSDLSKYVVDPGTQIILKCCELGRNRTFLRVIRKMFDEVPDVKAPVYEILIREIAGKWTERFFWALGPVYLPTKQKISAPFDATNLQRISKELQKLYPHRSAADIDGAVKMANVKFTSDPNLKGWSQAYPPTSNTFDCTIYERENGALFVVVKEKEYTLKTKGGGYVSDATLKVAFGEAFDLVSTPSYEHWDADPKVNTRAPRVDDVPKHYEMSAELRTARVYLHIPVVDGDGKPLVADEDDVNQYGCSSFLDHDNVVITHLKPRGDDVTTDGDKVFVTLSSKKPSVVLRYSCRFTSPGTYHFEFWSQNNLWTFGNQTPDPPEIADVKKGDVKCQMSVQCTYTGNGAVADVIILTVKKEGEPSFQLHVNQEIEVTTQ